MKKLWKRKWAVIGASVLILLSMGAVAWAAGGPGGNSAGAGEPQGAAVAPAAGVCAGLSAQECRERRAEMRELWQDRRAEMRERWQDRRAEMKEQRDRSREKREALMDTLREEMTPEDQATYDRLVRQAAEQRAALEKARQDLRSTMQELKELMRKYLDDSAPAVGAGL